MAKRLVILESPFKGNGSWWFTRWLNQRKNIRYARACVRHSLSLNEHPIASHLLYTQPGILRDDVPDERQWGIDAGLAWLRVADGTVVYIDRGVSGGMAEGITAACRAEKPVEYRTLGGDWTL